MPKEPEHTRSAPKLLSFLTGRMLQVGVLGHCKTKGRSAPAEGARDFYWTN